LLNLCNNTNGLLRDVGTQKYCLLATSSNKTASGLVIARLKCLWPFDLDRCFLGSRAFTAAILQHITMLFSRVTVYWEFFYLEYTDVYIGCYVDDGNERLLPMKHTTVDPHFNSVTNCIKTCQTFGFRYAGMYKIGIFFLKFLFHMFTSLMLKPNSQFSKLCSLFNIITFAFESMLILGRSLTQKRKNDKRKMLYSHKIQKNF
jgi:hypothetical protein